MTVRLVSPSQSKSLSMTVSRLKPSYLYSDQMIDSQREQPGAGDIDISYAAAAVHKKSPSFSFKQPSQKLEVVLNADQSVYYAKSIIPQGQPGPGQYSSPKLSDSAKLTSIGVKIVDYNFIYGLPTTNPDVGAYNLRSEDDPHKISYKYPRTSTAKKVDMTSPGAGYYNAKKIDSSPKAGYMGARTKGFHY